MPKEFKNFLDAKGYLVNTETDLVYNRDIDDDEFEEIIDEMLDEKIKNKEFIILEDENE